MRKFSNLVVNRDHSNNIYMCVKKQEYKSPYMFPCLFIKVMTQKDKCV